MKKIITRAPLGVALFACAQPALAQNPAAQTGEMMELPPIVVMGAKSEAPLMVVSEPKQSHANLPASDGAGYLKSITGMSMVRKGGTGGDPVFRGQAGSRLNILLDGTPLLGGCPGRMDPPTAYAFPESFDRIILLKGPQAVVHGGASAGTILFERDMPRFDKLGAKAEASVLVAGQGRNDEMLDVSAGTNWGFARALGTWSQSGDYRDGHGRLVHSAYERQSHTASLGWTPDRDTALVATVDFSEAEAAYADRMMDGTLFDRRDYKLMFSRDNVSPQISNITAQMFHNYVDHVMDRFTLRKWSGGMMNALSNPDRTLWGGNWKATLNPARNWSIIAGMDYTHDTRTLRTLSAAEYNAGLSYKSKNRQDDKQFQTISAFSEISWDMAADKRLVGGYRLTHISAQDQMGQSPDRDDSVNAGFVRFEHDIGGQVAYIGLGYAGRAPDYWERNKNWNVSTEGTTQLDLGLHFASGKWKGSVSGFANHTQDYILVSSSTAKNVDAQTFGAEIDVNYALAEHWTIQAGLAHMRGRNLSEDRALAQVPPMEVSLGLIYDDGTLSAALTGRAVASQNRVDQGWGNIASTDLGPSGGFATAAISGGWRVQPWFKVTAGVDNLFDTAYAEHISKAGTASLVSEGYEQTTRVFEPGRTFWAKGSLSF